MNRRVLFSLNAFCLILSFFFSPGIPSLAAQEIRNEAGFMIIEPISFSFQYGSYFNRLALRSSEARMFYSFQAADRDSGNKPLFVFFNGGPASATSCGLMSMNTGRYTIDNRIESGGGNRFILNSVPWTRLGNLLYIDAREAGFSYNVMSQVTDELARWREFNAQNYNPLFDAADFIRLILRFLDRHPALQTNRVVIVGESYGGDRTTCLLHLLLNYADYGNGREMFQDPALSREIQNHFDTVFPDYRGRIAPPEVIIRQFGQQILIQPSVPWGYREQLTEEMLRRPGSELYRIGEEVGIPYRPEAYADRFAFIENVAGRDSYIYIKQRGWLDGFFGNAGRLLRTTSNLVQVTGTDVTRISEFYAAARAQAYRFANPDLFSDQTEVPIPAAARALFLDPALREAAEIQRAEPGDMTAFFGALQPWDYYFLGNNANALWAFHIYNVAMKRGYEAHPADIRYGRMFLKNLAYVDTFVTDAAYDLVVYSKAFAPSLAKYTDILEAVRVSEDPVGGESRPGRVILTYKASAFPGIPAPGTRTIRFPLYDQSCHAVSLTQPVELYLDVAEWLRQKGFVVD